MIVELSEFKIIAWFRMGWSQVIFIFSSACIP